MAQTTSKSLQEPSKDFFISYNRADRNWAEWIAWQLEQTGFSVIIQEWDFRPGSNFVVEMDRASQQARRTIAILSHDYLHANDKKAEWAAAFQRDPTGEQSVLVPVRVKACDLKGLFSSIVYIDLVDLDETSAQEALLQGIRSRRARPSIAPAFPGRSQPPSFPGSEKQGTSSDLAMNPGSRRDILTEGQTGIEQAPESTANDLLIPSSLYLPPKVYHRLVGRSNELNKIMAALRAQKRRPMIALFGLGGMGKTALAREAVDRSQQLHLFDDIVWTSAKTERFIGETTIKTENSEYNFDEVLNSIGRQCNRLDITKLPLEKKTAAVQHLLANKRILIVMDNLETVAQSEVVVDNIFQILRKSKVIITSRHRIEHEQTFTMNLSGLSLDDGVSCQRPRNLAPK